MTTSTGLEANEIGDGDARNFLMLYLLIKCLYRSIELPLLLKEENLVVAVTPHKDRSNNQYE